jgi:hypothetical protein
VRVPALFYAYIFHVSLSRPATIGSCIAIERFAVTPRQHAAFCW